MRSHSDEARSEPVNDSLSRVKVFSWRLVEVVSPVKTTTEEGRTVARHEPFVWLSIGVGTHTSTAPVEMVCIQVHQTTTYKPIKHGSYTGRIRATVNACSSEC